MNRRFSRLANQRSTQKGAGFGAFADGAVDVARRAAEATNGEEGNGAATEGRAESEGNRIPSQQNGGGNERAGSRDECHPTARILPDAAA